MIESPDQDPVIFIDVDASEDTDPVDVAARLRSAPPAPTASARHIVFRPRPGTDGDWAHEVGKQLRAALDRLRVQPDLSVITLSVGASIAQADITADGSVKVPADLDLRLISRCRHIEIAALLRHNNGVWRPPDYHFRLPSGSHGSCFVRVADSIRTPRDAAALATWLAPFVREQSGLLVDSASLVGLTSAIDAMAARAGVTLGPVVSLEEYPKNRLDTMKAVRDVDRGSNVVALLSVHSTGSLLNRMLTALEQVASKEWTLQILVDKASEFGSGEYLLPVEGAGSYDRTSVWTHLGEAADVPPEDCASCRRGPGRIAQIDPRTFDGMVLPTPELLTPSVIWAYKQRRLWEVVDAADAVTLDATSDVSNLHPRFGTDKFMSVKVNFGDLLADATFDELSAATRDRLLALVADRRLTPPYDLILVDEREGEHHNFERLVDVVRSTLDVDRSEVFPRDDVDVSAIQSAGHILIFRLGLVSGLSLQQALYGVQQIRRGTSKYTIDALVLHLRPEDGRVRETLENSLARHLAYAWESYIPEDRHPLQDELEIIGALHDELPVHVAAFLEERLATCTGFPTDGQLLWAAGPHTSADATRLSPMSYFGEELRVRSAFAAIGAAVHHARVHADAPRSAPHWRVFEMPAIFRSYYDPIILCCILRWLRSTEVWWGEDLRSARAALENVVRRTRGGPEATMLVSELLLGCAQAKVPAELTEYLMTEAEVVAGTLGTPDDAALRLGIAVARRSLD